MRADLYLGSMHAEYARPYGVSEEQKLAHYWSDHDWASNHWANDGGGGDVPSPPQRRNPVPRYAFVCREEAFGGLVLNVKTQQVFAVDGEALAVVGRLALGHDWDVVVSECGATEREVSGVLETLLGGDGTSRTD